MNVRIADAEFFIAEGESIHTENSHKYNSQDVCDLAEAAGFEVQRAWTDERNYFSVQYLTVRE